MSKKIKVKCFICDTIGYIPEDYQGNIRCPNCKSSFKRTGNPTSLVRKQLLEKLDDLAHIGFSKIIWIGGDKHSCERCKSRKGTVYTVQEIREILNSEFCDSDPFEQGCRCTIGIYNEKSR